MHSDKSPEDTDSTEERSPTPESISHDQIWKTLLVHFVQDFFQLIHPKLAASLDLSNVAWLDKESFLDFPKGKHVEADLLGKAKTRDGEDRILLLHHEFEATFRTTTDARINRYILYLRLKHDLPVLSVVLFLKGGPKGLQIRSVVDRIGDLEVYRASYCAFGFKGLLAEEWLKRPEPLAAAFASLMRSKVWDPVEKKFQCLRAITQAKVNEACRIALADVVKTYVELTPEEAERFAAELTQERNQEIREMEMSWSQKLRAEGEAIGLVRGRDEGRAQGVRSAIVLLWENKFGSLSDVTRERLEEIQNLPSLYEILEQVSTAEGTEEIPL